MGDPSSPDESTMGNNHTGLMEPSYNSVHIENTDEPAMELVNCYPNNDSFQLKEKNTIQIIINKLFIIPSLKHALKRLNNKKKRKDRLFYLPLL